MRHSKALAQRLVAAVTAASMLALSSTALADADIFFVNFDQPGAGLNDPTPAEPIGGNPGTTIGEQRQVAYFFATQLWGNVLNSDTPVFVGASFQNQTCTPTGAVLGSAGTTFVFSDFPGAQKADTWYGSALADSLAGTDLQPGFIDINSRFNALIGTDPNCLGGRGWYYGLDNNPPPGDIDFLNVVMHEIGHGLGVQGFESTTSGQAFLGRTSIFSNFVFDNDIGKLWSDMTVGERLFSATNDGKVAWVGAQVVSGGEQLLAPAAAMSVNSPASIAGDYPAQAASFGAAITLGGISGDVVLADDGVGAPADGCEPLLQNLSGQIALIDRGACAFTQKVLNAQNAGAIAAIVANNAPGGPAPMGGADPAVTIPSIGITLADGNTVKSELAGTVNVTIALNPAFRAGGDGNGNVLMYLPNPARPGSSYSHYDVSATPNLLMEPSINRDLTASVDIDLTPALLADTGWTLDTGNGQIEGCDTGLPSYQEGGSIIGATVEALSEVCAVFGVNHGSYVSCMAKATNDLKARGAISGKEKGKVQSCAANSSNGK